MLRAAAVPGSEEYLGKDLLHESGPPPYVAVQTRRSLYVEFKNGWRELYNLKKDPWELNNIAGSARTKPLQAALSGDLSRLYDTPPTPPPPPTARHY